MPTLTPNFAYGVANVIIPRGGPKTVVAVLDYTGTDGIYEIDGSQLVQQAKIEYIQCLYVDNADNPNDLVIETDLTNQRIICPAGSQGYYSILQPNPPKFTFTTTAGAFKVPVQFLNVPVQPCVWGGSASGGGALTNAELRATPLDAPLSYAFNNLSIANLTGASQILVAPNNTRRSLLIQNISVNNMGINLSGGVAAIGTAGTITILAGGSISFDGNAPIGQITIIGTANDDVTAYEGE